MSERGKRNPDQFGIDWDRDRCVMRGVTAGKVAIYEDTNGCAVIRQRANCVVVGSRDLEELIRRLCELAYELGYESPTSPPRHPPRLLPFPGGKTAGTAQPDLIRKATPIEEKGHRLGSERGLTPSLKDINIFSLPQEEVLRRRFSA